MMRSAALSCVVVALSLAVALAQPTTEGTRFEGYSYASDVQGYVNMTMDACDIYNALDAGDMDTAKNVYQNGSNSMRGSGLRSFMGFATHAPGEGVEEPSYTLFTAGRDPNWLHDAIMASTNAAEFKALIKVATLKYALHEYDAGLLKMKAYHEAKAENPDMDDTLISDESGAPHNVDEGAALWLGGMDEHCGTLHSTAEDLSYEMTTQFMGKGLVPSAMVELNNEMLGQARLADTEAFEAALEKTYKVLGVMGLQLYARNMYAADVAANCDKPEEAADAKATVIAHWSWIKPFLAIQAGPNQLEKLEEYATADTANFQAVKPYLKKVAKRMGLSDDEWGMPGYKRINAEWNCPKGEAKPGHRKML